MQLFTEFINESKLNAKEILKTDHSTPKYYWTKLKDDIENGKEIFLCNKKTDSGSLEDSDGTLSVIIKKGSETDNAYNKLDNAEDITSVKNQDIKFNIEKIINKNDSDENKEFIKKNIKNNIIKITNIFKGQYSNSGNKNSAGRKHNNELENEVIDMCKIVNEKERNSLFTEKPVLKNIYNKILEITGTKNLDDYFVIHDANEQEHKKFPQLIASIAKMIGFTKDDYTPADMYLVKKDILVELMNSIEYIKDDKDENGKPLEAPNPLDLKIICINSLFYKYYIGWDKNGEHINKKSFIPISLKQINEKGEVKSSLYNTPSKDDLEKTLLNATYFTVDLKNLFDESTHEIGQIKVYDNNHKMLFVLQNRTRPYGYTATQTEMTHEGGVSTGGRVGNVPARVIDLIFNSYNYKRINKIANYFGPENDKFSKFNNIKMMLFSKKFISCEKYMKKYSPSHASNKNQRDFISLISKIVDVNTNNTSVDNDDIKDLRSFGLMEAKKDTSSTTNEKDPKTSLMNKLQGLHLVYFLVANKKYLNQIATDMMYGAKRIGPKHMFYFKIY